MQLKWKKIRHQEVYLNSEKNIQLRKIFAQKMLQILEEGKIIINFDESAINSSTSRSYSWERRGQIPGRCYKRVTSGLSILSAVSSSGDIVF